LSKKGERNTCSFRSPLVTLSARFVNNNFYNREPGAVTAMISELSWETLEQRRAKTRAVLMYEIINNLVDIPSHTLLIPADGRTRGTTVYRVIYTRIDAYKYPFFPRTILTWNHIPQELRLVPTIDQFRAGLGRMYDRDSNENGITLISANIYIYYIWCGFHAISLAKSVT
jgi:hypothetical protein